MGGPWIEATWRVWVIPQRRRAVSPESRKEILDHTRRLLSKGAGLAAVPILMRASTPPNNSPYSFVPAHADDWSPWAS